MEERLVLSAAVLGAAIDGVHPRVATTGRIHMGHHNLGHHHLGRHHGVGATGTGTITTTTGGSTAPAAGSTSPGANTTAQDPPPDDNPNNIPDKIFPQSEDDIGDGEDLVQVDPAGTPDGLGALPGVSPAVTTGTWTLAGPAPITGGQVPGSGAVAGRIAGLAADPTNASIIYAATSGGGVWKTINGGTTWTALTDTQSTLTMGAIAVSKSNPSVIYAGTGEANNSGDSFYGRGVLKSTDAGATWTLVGNSSFNRRVISKVVIDPTDSNVVYVTVGGSGVNGQGGNDGVWKSTNGGTTWTNTTASATGISGSTSVPFSDLVMDPTDPQTLYCAVGSSGGNAINGIYKTSDGGLHWAIAGNFPLSSTNGRIAFAIANSNNQILYCAITSSSTSGLKTFLKSTDAGATWAATAVQPPNYQGGQGWYDTYVGVDPSNPNIVYAGGAASGGIVRTTDGGSTWTAIDSGSGTGSGTGTHADHHAYTFDASGRFIDGDDGGIWRLDGATTGNIKWTDLNGNLAITEFIGIGVQPSNDSIAFGGSQDNGTEQYNNGSGWPEREGGDGGNVEISWASTGRVYHVAPVGSFGASAFFRGSTNGGTSWTSKVNGITSASSAAFYPPWVLDQDRSTVAADRLLLGTNQVYESTDSANDWTAISTPNSGGWTTSSSIGALAVAPTDGNTIYAAAGGSIFVTHDDGGSWTGASVSSVADIAVDPNNAQIAYAVRSAFTGNGTQHVYRTTNGGTTWTDFTSASNLPDLPVYSIQLDAASPGTIYIGTDNGVYVNTSANSGVTWAKFGTGLPNVQVHDLELNKNRTLSAGTYGRSMWQIRLNPPPITGFAGQVFNDANGNGVKDAGEAGLPGWTVYVDANNNGQYDPASVKFAASNLPQAIPDFDDTTGTPGELDSTLNASGLLTSLSQVTVNLDITHTYDADLQAFLVSPSGTQVELFSGVGGNGQNFTNTTFDDTATTSINSGSAPFTGTFAPSGTLGTFAGENPNGQWTLRVLDNAHNDTGTLNGWSLSVKQAGADVTTTTDASGNYAFTKQNPGTYHVGVVLQPAYRQTKPATANGQYTITIAQNQNSTGNDFGVTNVNGPQFLSAVSRMTHNGVAYDVPITPDGTAIEDRDTSNGATVVFTFDRAINGGTASVTSADGNATVAGVTLSGSQMFVTLAGVDDTQAVTVTAQNVTSTDGTGTLASQVATFHTSLGDINANGSISASDVNALKAAIGQPLTGFNYRADLNASGSITASDVNLLKSKIGQPGVGSAATETPPSISGIGGQTAAAGTTVGPVTFTVGDLESPAGSLALAGSSDTQSLLPNANITFGGSGASRTITLTPIAGQKGTAIVTVLVGDGLLTNSVSFAATWT